MPLLVRTLVLGALLAAPLRPPAAAADSSGDPAGRALATVLGAFDAAHVPSGILYDRVVPLSHLERFDGGPGAPPADFATWRQMTDEVRRASLRDTGMPARGALEEDVRQAARAGTVPLALLALDYDRIRPDAVERGLARVVGERLVPVAPGTLARARVFALGVLGARTWRGARVVFTLEARHLLTAGGPPPARLEVDLDDGGGFRALRPGGRLVARYATTGTKTLRVRGLGADGAPLEARTPFRVEALAVPTPDDTLHVTASVPYQGQYGTGDAYVWLAPGHAVLTNPIVVPEGFDLDNTMNWDELYALLDQQGLADTLHAHGFDEVVLNFTDATRPVQENALVLAQLIQDVEAAAGPQATLAVVGPSMGGLCSRYALAWLESQAIGHRVRTWISFDAPHRGADIPLGMQYWMAFFAGQSADAAHWLDRLDTPAARQMLVYHHTAPPGATGQADPLRAGLLADFAAVGDWPALPRRVALANGSGAAANQGFAAGDQIVQYVYSSAFVSITGNVWAVPDQVSHTIFDGKIRILLSTTSQNVTVSGTRPYDGAPGGWRASMAEMDSSQAPYGDIVALHPAHDFIPTVSALALPDTTGLFHDDLGDPGLLAKTPFDAVYAPLENQEHVTITSESAPWILAEIERGVVSVPEATPGAPVLRAPAPDPFRGATRIAFTLAVAGPADLRVFDVAGREVATLLRGRLSAGTHEVRWDGTGAAGRPVPAGLFFVRLVANGRRAVQRLVHVE